MGAAVSFWTPSRVGDVGSEMSGRRCGETWQLTFEHRLPVALGGQHSVGGISWLCAAHNRLMADRVLGSEVMAAKVEAARAARATDARISSVRGDL